MQMTEPSQPVSPNNQPTDHQETQQEKSQRIKKRLIWLGIVLAIIGALDVGYLIKNVISPSFF
jgi:hypothetical protein